MFRGISSNLSIKIIFCGNKKEPCDASFSFCGVIPSEFTFAKLESYVTKHFSISLNHIVMRYLDDERDEITVTSEDEWQAAMEMAINNDILLLVRVYSVSQNNGWVRVGNASTDSSDENECVEDSVTAPTDDTSTSKKSACDGAKGPDEVVVERMKEELYKTVGSPMKFAPGCVRCLPRSEQEYNKAFSEKSFSVVSENESNGATGHTTPVPSLTNSGFSLLSISRPVHRKVRCGECRGRIEGVRYKCGNCVQYDLCERCEEHADKLHDPLHVFLKIRIPMDRINNLRAPLLPRNIYTWERQDGFRRHTLSSDSSSSSTPSSSSSSSASSRLRRRRVRGGRSKKEKRKRKITQMVASEVSRQVSQMTASTSCDQVARWVQKADPMAISTSSKHQSIQTEQPKEVKVTRSISPMLAELGIGQPRTDVASQCPRGCTSLTQSTMGSLSSYATLHPVRYDAKFISHLNYPDGSWVRVGQHIEKKWLIQNIGLDPWQEGEVKLVAQPLLPKSQLVVDLEVPVPACKPLERRSVSARMEVKSLAPRGSSLTCSWAFCLSACSNERPFGDPLLVVLNTKEEEDWPVPGQGWRQTVPSPVVEQPRENLLEEDLHELERWSCGREDSGPPCNRWPTPEPQQKSTDQVEDVEKPEDVPEQDEKEEEHDQKEDGSDSIVVISEDDCDDFSVVGSTDNESSAHKKDSPDESDFVDLAVAGQRLQDYISYSPLSSEDMLIFDGCQEPLIPTPSPYSKLQVATESEPAKDEPTNDEPAKDEPTNDERAKDEPTNEEPAKDEPTNDEGTTTEQIPDQVPEGNSVSLPQTDTPSNPDAPSWLKHFVEPRPVPVTPKWTPSQSETPDQTLSQTQAKTTVDRASSPGKPTWVVDPRPVPVRPQWTPDQPPSNTYQYTTDPAMLQLYNMGFCVQALNQRLLDKHDRDMEKVIDELISMQ